MHVLVNGLSVGDLAGSYTVALALTEHLARARPTWRVTLAVRRARPLVQHLLERDIPSNSHLLWAPPIVANLLARTYYESVVLRAWVLSNDVSALVQPNGMIVPGLDVPTLCHFQDPSPYVSSAWSKKSDAIRAAIKRQRHFGALRKASHVGWTSDYLRSVITSYHDYQPAHQSVLYNGLGASWLDSIGIVATPWNERPLRIITVGYVTPHKRQDLVIRAIALLVNRYGIRDVEYVIVGPSHPAYAHDLARLASELGVGECVILKGRVADSEMRDLVAHSRCAVLMSVCESFGIPLVEAMALGTPVIAAQSCAMPEVCGDAAELIPIDDVEALAASLARLLRDEQIARRLQRAGWVRARDFSWATTAGQMAEILAGIGQG